MNAYAIYLRKSRADLDAEARGEGETLARHRTALRALAERRGLNVVQEYAELVTGDSIAARPQMQALLDDVKRGMYAGVIVNDVDRLGRGDSIDQEIIKYTFSASHCLIITPGRDIDPASPSDQDMLDFSMFFARFEYRKISQRLMQGRIRSAEAGNYIGSRIPFGYKQVKNGRRITLEPDPETAPIVKMMFEVIASGEIGYNALTTRLNEMGLRTTRGYQFYPHTVKNILENPVYIGTARYGRTKTITAIENGKKVKHSIPTDGAVVVENAHPAIITRELFDKVQARYSNSNATPRTNTNKALSNPLAGLVRCSICGKVLRVQNCKRGRSLMCLSYGCPTVGSPLYAVEREVLDTLKGWCVEYANVSPEPTPEVQGQVEALQKQLDTINARLSKARELVELGVYTPVEFTEQKNMLLEQSRAIEKQINKSRVPLSQTIHAILPEIKRIIDAYEYAESATEKNQLLKSIINKIVYEKTQRAIGKQNPTAFLTLTVYPKVVL